MYPTIKPVLVSASALALVMAWGGVHANPKNVLSENSSASADSSAAATANGGQGGDSVGGDGGDGGNADCRGKRRDQRHAPGWRRRDRRQCQHSG
ncbi:hypothetical protein [Thiohalobacter thiocyanaticus]|uniref:Uncharacterized protein n=1 Tax=Thiohalobacter thiocyanaticus TaxID=585455 RepID=A0A426QFH4_9GAMM|nr:hypothetical protein [Thiohalobacter thiocyanaticus]RRQ20535.1 hypothetical protein D6C00_00055 [Thiohalobacter thiocyanaticus]